MNIQLNQQRLISDNHIHIHLVLQYNAWIYLISSFDESILNSHVFVEKKQY
jgi:hypothetical protein